MFLSDFGISFRPQIKSGEWCLVPSVGFRSGTGTSFNKFRPSSSKKCWHISLLSLSTGLLTGRSPQTYFVMVWLRLWGSHPGTQQQWPNVNQVCRRPSQVSSAALLFLLGQGADCAPAAGLLPSYSTLNFSCGTGLSPAGRHSKSVEAALPEQRLWATVSLSFSQDWWFSYKFYHHLNSHEFLAYVYCSVN